MDKILFENIKLTHFERNEVIGYFKNALSVDQKRYITFINPEIFLQQEKDSILNEYFQNADVNLIDGVNLFYAINKKCNTHYDVKDRLPGTDFFTYLPNDININIFFYGAKKENCIKAKTEIEKKYQNVKIVDYIDGYTSLSDEEIINRINSQNIDIVIVCLGCPKQEYWIKNNFDKINTKIIFGNGGSIDFWSGNTKRAPKIFINLGIEWLFRLFASFSISRVKRQMKLAKFLIKYKLKRYNICLE